MTAKIRKNFDLSYGCTYCNGIADVWDHVIPKSYLRERRTEFAKEDWVVPACHLCNSILSNTPAFSVPARADFLYHRYRKKFKRILNSPYWSDDDIEELGDNLKSVVRQYKEAQQELDRRLVSLNRIRKRGWDYMRDNRFSGLYKNSPEGPPMRRESAEGGIDAEGSPTRCDGPPGANSELLDAFYDPGGED